MTLSEVQPSNRTSSRITCILLCVGAIALGFVLLRDTGLLSEEAVTLSRYNAAEAMQATDIWTQLTLQQPVMQTILRIAGFLYTYSVHISRLLTLLFGVWCILLLWSISRASKNADAAVWVTALAVLSWFYINLSITLSPAIIIVWAILLVQWAFMRILSSQTWKNLIIYAAIVAVALLTTVHIRSLLLLQGVWCIGTVVHSFINKKSTGNTVHYIIAAVIAGVACTLASMPVLGGSLHFTPFVPALKNTATGMWQMCSWILFSFESSGSALFTVIVYISIGLVFFLALISTVYAFVTRRASLIFIFFATILSPFFCYLTLNSSDSERVPYAFLLSFPFMLVLTGTGIQISFSFLIKCGHQAKKSIFKILFISGGYVFTVLFLAGWIYIQYNALQSGQRSRANRDITLTRLFLEKCVSPGDTVTVIADGSLYSSPLLRFGCVPYVNTLTNSVSTETRVRWNSVSQWATNNHVTQWFIDTSENPNPLRGRPRSFYIPFKIPVAGILPAGADTTKVLPYLYDAVRIAPYADAVSLPLLNWYRDAPQLYVQRSMANGTAARYLQTRDSFKPHRDYWRRAVNRTLYSWSEMPVDSFTAQRYEPFARFAYNVRGAEVDTRRIGRVFRYYIENALAASNTAAVGKMIEDARQWDSENPFLYRHTAEWYAQKDPNAFDQRREMNQKAREEFQKRFNRPYVDAWIALILVEKQAGNYDASLEEMYALLDYVQNKATLPEEIVNNPTPQGEEQREDWKKQLMKWEAQCNNLISQLLLETGDEEKALWWQKKNLEEHFDIEYHRVAHERLAKMYYKLGRIDDVFAQYDELIRIASTPQEKLHWRVNKAHLAVTMGETVRAYDMWQIISSRIGALSVEERREWARDKRYQRIMRHLERRTQMDVRDAVIATLRRRAAIQPENAPRYLQNAAQLYRCKLQYGMALSTLGEAIQNSPQSLELYLDKALLNYRLLRYKNALEDFTALNEATNSLQKIPSVVRDWRYRILLAFAELKKPPPRHIIMEWTETHTNLFASQAELHNHYGNLYASYGMFDEATNSFTHGITTDSHYLDNYLDLGYMYCTRSDADAAGELLDMLDSRQDINHKNLETDWRYIELHHVSIRPYSLDEK